MHQVFAAISLVRGADLTGSQLIKVEGLLEGSFKHFSKPQQHDANVLWRDIGQPAITGSAFFFDELFGLLNGQAHDYRSRGWFQIDVLELELMRFACS